MHEILMLLAALIALIALVIAIPIGLEREDRRICIQAESWVQNNGAPETVVPDYCEEKGYLERK